jgi:putative DNA primase/helicase
VTPGAAYRRVEWALHEHGSHSNGRGEWQCPSHEDREPSLSLNQGERGAVLHCHAGCATETILEALGLQMPDLFDRPSRKAEGGNQSQRRIAAVYDYQNEDGDVLFQTVRYEPKAFRQRRPDGNGGYFWNLRGLPLIPYRLPELVAAVAAGDAIYVCEGERDAGSVRTAGSSATCNPLGAGKWRPEFAEYLRGASEVRVVADKDKAGYRHAADVAESLRGLGVKVTVLESPVGKDVSDLLDAGGALEDLVEIDLANRLACAKRKDPTTGERTTEHLTDLGNARRLARLHGQDLRFVHAWGKWLVWDGQRWATDADAEVMRRAKATVATIYEEASWEPDPDVRKAIASHARRSESEPRLKAMISLAASEPGIPIQPDELDQDAWSLNVLNGTIDLRTGKLRAHDHDDRITKLAPISYHPGTHAPRWKAHLERVIPDPEVRAFLRRAVGYSLTGLTVEQVLFIVWGGGINGKSVTVETLLELLGEYACKTPSETLLARRDGGIPNDVARLRGARFVSSVEMEEGRRLAESRIKELTGGDTVTARFMRAEFFDFRPVCKIWMATNHKPLVRGTDLAIWRRLRLIPFTITIPEAERDINFLEKLRAELPGILAWAVRGCLEWQRDGLNPPDAVLLATESYREDQDVLGTFLDDRCLLGPGYQVLSGELYRAYAAWCDQNAEKPMSRRELAGRLGERGCQKDRKGHGGKRAWRGIGLRDGDG